MTEKYEEEVERYAHYLKEHGRTETTIKNNRKSLKNFFKKVRVKSMDDITEDTIRYFIEHSGMKESSVKRYLTNLDTMFYALRGAHPVKDMDLLWNRANYYRLFIEKDDFVKVLDHTDDIRTRLILTFGAYMGLRTVEMERMLVSDIKGDHILIRGKGHANGYLEDMRIPEIVKDELRAYLHWRERQGVTIPYMFFIKRDGMFRDLGEGSNIIAGIILRAGEKVGIKVTPHSLRRLFATTLYYELKVDPVTVKDLMRHANVSTTLDNYIRAYPKNRDDALDRLTELYTHHK